MTFKRSAFNTLIDDVNAVITTPPSGCDPLPALEHVPANHRWAKSDIRALQDAIKATCAEIVFDPIPNLWKQSTLDEIREKLEQAWCACDCDPHEGSGATFTVWESEPPRVLSDCFGDDIGSSGILLCSIIEGMTVAPAGVRGRNWHLTERRIFNDGHIVNVQFFAVGGIRCNGTVACTGVKKVARYGNGLVVNCFGNCSSIFCTNAIANAEADMAAHPENFCQFVYILTVITQGADCDCD